MKELIYKKGLLLKVVSWENDGDNYKTTETYINTIEEGKALKHMFEVLFKSENNGKNGIGNASEGDDKSERIEEYRQENEFFKEKYTKKEFFNYINDTINEGFMEWSEFYSYRVCESATLYEIKEDVYLERIEIK